MLWLQLFLTFTQAAWIDVPFVHQEKNGCGSAVVWMVLEYWKQGSAPQLEDIHRKLYSRQAAGIYSRDIESYLQARGFNTFTFRGEWIDLQQHVAKGRPLIVVLEKNARGIPLHYVVVAGIDDRQDLILINDPADRKLRSVERAEFEKTWRAMDNWTLLAVPEVDLASEAFREERHSEAAAHLSAALRSNPSDPHTNEFLATVHFLENDIESALKYWNRVGKPEINEIKIDPPLRMKPVLLDRAFAFSRGDVLTLPKYRTTRARLEGTELFSRADFDLVPSQEDRFDLVLRSAERDAGPSISWLRGLPYQTVYPELFNIGGEAVNLRSLLRWNPDRQRARAEIAAPIGGNPKWRYEFAFDVRRENWSNSGTEFQMRRGEASAKITSISSGRWSWTSGLAFARRSFTNDLAAGHSVKYVASSTQELFRSPNTHFAVATTVRGEAGRMWGASSARFAKVGAELDVTWKEMSARLLASSAAGSAPFDELFVLGLDRDSALWLRATRDRITTRSFGLMNWDLLKSIHEGSFFKVRAGPFVDIARTGRWLADTGLQFEIKALGSVTANVSVGTNLRTGDKVWFVNTSR